MLAYKLITDPISVLIYLVLLIFSVKAVFHFKEYRYPFLFLSFAFFLILFVCTANVLENSLNSKLLDSLEEYIELLFFPMLLLFAYSLFTAKESAKTKRYAKELEHRVRNNLQVIISLLDIQLINLNTPTEKKLINDTRTRINTIGITEDLLYRHMDSRQIELTSFLDRLMIYHNFNAGASPKLQINCSQSTLNIETLLPFGLIINELLLLFLDKKPDSRNYPLFRLSQSAQFYVLEINASLISWTDISPISKDIMESAISQLKAKTDFTGNSYHRIEFAQKTNEENRWLNA